MERKQKTTIRKNRKLQRDLSGLRFGRWSVLYPTDKRRHNQVVYCCRCDCGTERLLGGSSIKTGQSRSCGCLRDEVNKAQGGPPHPKWKERRLSTQGYVLLKSSSCNANIHGEVLEHRAVMENHLKRPLSPHEHVHHINGEKTDNRLENLELWSFSHPAGQRVVDKIVWAEELLRLYAPEKLSK